MRNYTEYTYYTLEELMNINYVENPSEVPMLGAVYESIFGVQRPQLRDEVEVLWSNYIVPTYFDAFVVRAEETSDTITSLYKKWLAKFMALIQSTEQKYIPLIEHYEDAANHLMDDIHQKSTVRLNDTPYIDQNLSGVEYTSNITVNDTETQGGTTAVRLAEVKAVWENLYYQWMREFHGLFMI